MEGQNGDNWRGATADHDAWLDKEMNMMMVVALLIAGMAFQVGVNPPDGLWNTVALFSSLTIIFLLITGLPISRRSFMGILRAMCLISITCIAMSYFAIMQYLWEIEGGHGPFDGKDNLQFSLMIVWLTAMIFALLVRVTPAKWRNELPSGEMNCSVVDACYESEDAAA